MSLDGRGCQTCLPQTEVDHDSESVFQDQPSAVTAVRTTQPAAPNNETVATTTPVSRSTREVRLHLYHNRRQYWILIGQKLLTVWIVHSFLLAEGEKSISFKVSLRLSGSPVLCLSAGGMTYRQCLKYSDCEYGRLAQMFPQVTATLLSSGVKYSYHWQILQIL